MIYAERLRRELQDNPNATMEIDDINGTNLPPAMAFVQFINSDITRQQKVKESLQRKADRKQHMKDLLSDDVVVEPPEISTEQRISYDIKKKLDTIDLVVLSDTHGFEGQFDQPLPEGDVLLHLGDFAFEGSVEAEHQGLAAFDSWLAKQKFDYKIIVRGNHDPYTYDFAKSKAMYVTTPTSINIGGFEMATRPSWITSKACSCWWNTTNL